MLNEFAGFVVFRHRCLNSTVNTEKKKRKIPFNKYTISTILFYACSNIFSVVKVIDRRIFCLQKS